MILASASTARRAVLAGAGLRFTARPAAIDEAAIKDAARSEGLDATAAALRLADAKAAWVARQEPQALVVGADQILVCDGAWYDKPEDLAAARRQLLALRGRTHALATAVACRTGDKLLWQHTALPRLTMRAFSEPFLDAYLAAEGDRVLGSVGAYRLEGPGVQLFARVEGDHATILGLPLLPLLVFLRDAGAVLG
ncbi:MAG: Maf family protein [Acetobacteraceae bacterium]